MSTNLNQYTKILGKYNTTLKEYREALQRGDSYTTNQKYHGLIKLSEELKIEFARIEPYLQAMKVQYHELKNANDNAYSKWETLNKQYIQTGSRSDDQKMNDAKEVSRKASSELESFEKEFKLHEFRAEIINEMNRLQAEDITIRIHYNETRSEGDLISKEQRQQDKEVYDEIRTIIDQTYSLSEMTSSRNVKQETKVVENYTGHLSSSELNTVVLDDHMFYRLITSKQYQYTNDQFDKIFYGVSENLAKKPMTLDEIIGFCRENGIPHFSDDEFRSLIKNDNKDYEDISRSVRDVADYNYIPKDSEMTANHQTSDSHPRGNVNTATMVDADSFYKFIDTKMVRGEYTNEQHYKLYVDISEVLVHSPLTKGGINEIYSKYGIKPLTEWEWSKLIERQEARRETDHISKNSDHLKFQGSVYIEFKNQDFKFKVDLYHNKCQVESQEMKGILLETAKAYNESFGIRKSGDVAHFRVFTFSNREDYLKYSKEARGHATTSDNGNVANVYLFFRDNNYQNDDLLRHEFAHALTFHATSKLGLSRTFMEGIAEYTVGKIHGKSNADFVELIPPRNFNKSLRELINDPECESDHYITGAAIVAYLEEKHPNFLDNLLYAANYAIKSDRHIDVMEMIDKFFQKQEDKPINKIKWFKNHFNYDADDAHAGHPDHRSEGGYSGPPVQVKPLDKQNPVDNNAIQPEAQKPIILDFKIERGEPINQYYFSARIKLTENSKDLLRDMLGDDVRFNNDHFNLNNNFFIYYNEGAHRDELYIRDGNSMLAYNLPLNSYTFKVLFNGFEIEGYNFYSTSNGMQMEDFDSSGKLLPTVKNMLDDLLNNSKIPGGAQNTLIKASNELGVREMKMVEARKHAEEQFNKDNEALKGFIDKGEVLLFKVIKGESIDGERSKAILQLTGPSKSKHVVDIVLDHDLFYIDRFGNFNDVKNNVGFKYDLCFIVNKSSYANLEDGFYSAAAINSDFPASYLNDRSKSIATIDERSHQKLLSILTQKQQYAHDEQMQGDQPQAPHKVDKHHAKHEDIVLKDTILSVGKGEEVTLPNGQKIHKAEIKIKPEDIESLYDKSSGEEQQYVLEFWYALDKNNYKIGDLLQEQYYFKGNKFIIKNKKGIELSRDEGKISLQLMHLKDHQGKDHLELVVLNKANGKVIGNVHEIDDLSYGLLRSDSDILSHLEIQGHDITIHGNDYDTYLTHGLE